MEFYLEDKAVALVLRTAEAELSLSTFTWFSVGYCQREDGYPNQFDSSDNQFSITMGFMHASKKSYQKMYYGAVLEK
jgi:hypothetical protein